MEDTPLCRSSSAPLMAPRRYVGAKLPPLTMLGTVPPAALIPSTHALAPQSPAKSPMDLRAAGAPRQGGGKAPPSPTTPPPAQFGIITDGELPSAKRRGDRLLSTSSDATTAEPATCMSSQVGASLFQDSCGGPLALALGDARDIVAFIPPALAMPKYSKKAEPSWIRGKALGSGSYGTVFKAFDPNSLQIFAVKELVLDDTLSGFTRQRERVDAELSICQSLRHPNIVSYLGHGMTEEYLHIYLEYVPGGSMLNLLAQFGPLESAALRKATRGTLEGLDYLHTHSPPIVHRDIKGANLLVDLDMTVKLTDFGCSKWNYDTKSFTTLGSIPWMAPEVITQLEGYGRKADVWSFGCTIIEMATGEKPWGNDAFDNMMFALNHIANSSSTPPLPDHAPALCRDLIRLCLRRVQGDRPSTAELLRHEFVSRPCLGMGRRRGGA